ncbi:hypothetical protein [Dyadobacter fermentans]|uniref:Lipoprotein n=1 Tax=Dyadobacter fermentans (strain ATCC 700827 / DSM 18053 / CIP 107007 / KCTC 52180 / NS114) TaxID=471854 RepID=C6VSM6_DYAFD|nr:hypothetical protein [Dyadobacter fermentans]ACT92848.1 hypothetical protein Dfer_1605 [Dyadobacter fermentans DSM 18053]
MKTNSYILIFLFALLLACKKDKDLVEFAPKPEPGPTEVLTVKDFLQKLDVTGAAKIEYDSLNKSFMVSLPDQFNDEEAEVKLTLQRDIFLLDSLGEKSPESVIHYKYSATGPLPLRLIDKAGKNDFLAHVYFNFTGTPTIELLQKEITFNSWGVKIPARFSARTGSIPRAPGQWGGITAKFTNKKTGFSTEAEIGDFETTIGFIGASNFVSDDLFTLELKLFNHNPVIFEGIKFIRGLPNIFFQPSYKYDFKTSDTINISGGYFLPEAKYKLTFSNDDMARPVTAQVAVRDSNWLRVDKIPATLSEGSYLVSVYENDRLIGNGSISIATGNLQAIETIWKGNPAGAVERNTNRPVLNRGEQFNAKPYPIYYGMRDSDFNVARLPRLTFASAAKTVDISPELGVYSWGIAGVYIGFGKYKVPNDLPPGLYTVTATFPDGGKTKPYWSRIEVK